MKNLFRHEYLTADNQVSRHIRQTHRDRADRPQIFCDILPYPAISPCCPTDKETIFIFQRDRKSIHLRLHYIMGIRDHPSDPDVKSLQFFKIKDILERLQGCLLYTSRCV